MERNIATKVENLRAQQEVVAFGEVSSFFGLARVQQCVARKSPLWACRIDPSHAATAEASSITRAGSLGSKRRSAEPRRAFAIGIDMAHQTTLFSFQSDQLQNNAHNPPSNLWDRKSQQEAVSYRLQRLERPPAENDP